MMLVPQPKSNEFWIPSVKVPEGSSWVSYMTKNLIQDIFGMDFQLDQLLLFNKVWLPTFPRSCYISHSIFNVDLKLDVKKKSKSLFGKAKIRWSNFEELSRFYLGNLLRSPELVDFICWNLHRPSPVKFVPSEHTNMRYFTEITDSILVTGKNTVYDQLVKASGINQKAQETVYREFLLFCFPSMYMSLEKFTKFVTQLGWAKEEIPHLFRSADLYERGGLFFKELLYFLAATEPSITFSGGPAELRCHYIFRYLDTDKNNILKRDEMKNFIVLRKLQRQSLDVSVEQELKECYQSMGFAENHSITMSEYVHAVGELKLRGTSAIYRAPNSIQKYIKEINERDSQETGEFAKKATLQRYNKDQAYNLAVHSVKIWKSGAAINIDQFWNINNAASLSGMRDLNISGANRKESSNKFEQNSKSNELLKAVRYLVQVNKNMNQPYTKIDSFCFNWGELDPNIVVKNLNSVCAELKEIFRKEPRLLEVPAPVYILGDLHGNIADLLYFEKIFWQAGPGLCPCNLLLLGDYVDRGLFSFEVVCYLFAYKLQTPRKLFMLRGNHEIRRVQIQWTFEKECKHKFGEKLGVFVFSIINEVFDSLPVAAVVDGKVFCCHGGIPPPWLCPVATAINAIPSILCEPQDQSPLAWEIMWNDPLRTKNMTDKTVMELLANEGFAMNGRRGTAHIFSVEALETFLAANGFTHLVRAHEVVEAGFYVQQKGHLVTVFSSSKYCGGANIAACILADQGKLRVLRLEIAPTKS